MVTLSSETAEAREVLQVRDMLYVFDPEAGILTYTKFYDVPFYINIDEPQ